MTDEPMGRLLKVNVSKDQKGRTTDKPQLAHVILHLVVPPGDPHFSGAIPY
jgi:hypothetical protein